MAAILVGLNSQRDDRGGGGVVAASVEVDGSGDHAHDQPRLTCDPSCFDLALRSETLTVDKRLWTNGAHVWHHPRQSWIPNPLEGSWILDSQACFNR